MAINIITAALMAATAGGLINWTVVIGVLTVSLTTMATLIKLFGPKRPVNDESLRLSPYLIELDRSTKIREEKLNAIKELVNLTNTEVEKLKVETKNSSQNLEEVKKDYRDLVQRLNDLLKLIMEYTES